MNEDKIDYGPSYKEISKYCMYDTIFIADYCKRHGLPSPLGVYMTPAEEAERKERK